MKMGHEAVAVCYQFNDIIIEQVGFNGRNADTVVFLLSDPARG